MTRYRPRAVLLLFLVLNLTACQTWQSVSLDAISPDQLIEEDRPDRVRVTGLIRTALAAWGAGTGLVMVLMAIGYVTGGGIG